jgi:hypothetical protein
MQWRQPSQGPLVNWQVCTMWSSSDNELCRIKPSGSREQTDSLRPCNHTKAAKARVVLLYENIHKAENMCVLGYSSMWLFPKDDHTSCNYLCFLFLVCGGAAQGLLLAPALAFRGVGREQDGLSAAHRMLEFGLGRWVEGGTDSRA